MSNRNKFEKWFFENFSLSKDITLSRIRGLREGEEYAGIYNTDIDKHLNTAWAAWKAATEWKDLNAISDCGCRFKDSISSAVLLCEECSKLPCHNPPQKGIK